MEREPSRVIIIGSGPAGFTAAIYCARADLSPIVYMGTRYGGQLMITSEVENFPGFREPVLGPKLMDDMKSQAERLGATLIQDDVTSVNFSVRPFAITTTNETRHASSVIVATGANPRRLGLESEMRLMGKGVSNCAVCDGFFFKNKKLAVVGGGDTALEEATFLTKFASSVTVIHRRGELRASKALQKEAFSNPKISFVWDSVVSEVLGGSRVEGVVIENVVSHRSDRFQVDGLFVAIGYDPNTEVFRGQLELDERGYVVTKNETETSVPGVFAAGDVRDFRYRQAVTAAADGCKAALDVDSFLKQRA